jgi:hypothetical protein
MLILGLAFFGSVLTMPVLSTVASDFTAWVRANAVLPTNGKASKSTLTTVNPAIQKVIAIGSKSAIGATPSTAISKRWKIVPGKPGVKVLLVATANNDALIAKYSSSGTIQWAAKLGGAGDDQVHRVATDSTGNLLVTGFFGSSTLSVYNGDGTLAKTLSNSGVASFIIKYNSTGVVQWAAQQNGVNISRGYGVSTDSTGNVIITGSFQSATFTANNSDGTAFGTTLTNSGSYDSFIVKYNSTGVVQWVAQQSGAGQDTARGGVAIDSGDNIIVAGQFYSTTLTLYNKDGTAFATTLTNSGGFDSFVVKYNSAGFVQWVAQQSGAAEDSDYGVATDSTDNIIITGFLYFYYTDYV